MKKILSLMLSLILVLSTVSVLYISAEDLPIPEKSTWKITANTEMGWGKAELMIDGKTDTIWHSKYDTEDGKAVNKVQPPYIIDITLPSEATVAGIRYTPRQNSNTGYVKGFEFYELSGETQGKLLAKGTFVGDDTIETFSWDAVNLSGIRIIFTSTVASGGVGTCAEIDLISPAEMASANDAAKLPLVETVPEKSTWKIKASSELNTEKAEKMIDGDPVTYWHSKYTVKDGKVDTTDPAPFTIDINLPARVKAAGIRYTPRQTSDTGYIKDYDVYALSGTAQGEKLASGTFIGDRTVEVVSWKETEIAGIRLVFRSTTGRVGTCGEIDILTKKDIDEIKSAEEKAELMGPREEYEPGFIPDKSEWKIKASSHIGNNTAEKMIDGDSSTYWHTNYKASGSTILSKDNPPFYVTITLPGTVTIGGFTYTPRQDNIKSGRIFKYNAYAILGGEEYLIGGGEWANDMGLKNSEWSFNVKLDALKLEFLDGAGGYGTCAELNLKPYDPNMAIVEPKDYAAAYEEGGLIAIPKKGMTAKCDAPLQWPDTGKVSAVVDGSPQSVWQTTKVEGPYVLDIDLNDNYYVAQINVLPRQSDDYHGLWLDFDVLYSVDGENYKIAKELLTFEKKKGEQVIRFDEPIHAGFIRFYINQGNDGRASCAEITFYESTNSAEQRAEDEKESYILKIGSNEIKSHKGGVDSVRTIDVAPYIAGAGYTLIPLRGLLEEMGATIEWNGNIQQILIEKDGTIIEMQIMSRSVYIIDSKGKEVRYTLNVPPKIKDSRTFIPVRFISEQLGYNVEWNGETQEITITK